MMRFSNINFARFHAENLTEATGFKHEAAFSPRPNRDIDTHPHIARQVVPLTPTFNTLSEVSLDSGQG